MANFIQKNRCEISECKVCNFAMYFASQSLYCNKRPMYATVALKRTGVTVRWFYLWSPGEQKRICRYQQENCRMDLGAYWMTYQYDLLLFANITLVTISVHVLLWIYFHEKFKTEEYLSLGVLQIKKKKKITRL